jgi:hypothetical protein
MLVACHNAKTGYDDYTVQTVYFPIQYPVRTISLGNDLVDNTLDRAHQFNIGVSIGGFYDRNNRDWRIDYAVDNSLAPDDYLQRSAGDTLKIMPPAYYTLNPAGRVTIPAGSFNGLIRVQLADAFFKDPLAVKGCYVIPLRITGSPDADNILRGSPAADAPTPPDVHVVSQWETPSKDYTLFGVKYVNPYHGKWLRRGQLTVRNQGGAIVETKVYHAEYVEQNEVVSLATTSLTGVVSTMSIAAETFKLNMEVAQDGRIVITSAADSPIAVTYGTGKYKENGDTWGGTPEKPAPRDAIYLDYFYRRASGFTCEVCDTLVFRDRGIVYEADHPTIINP